MREQIERELGLSAVNFYGLSEMCGPGVAAECLAARDGLHVQEDHFLAEVVEPESGTPLAEGEEGELVFTTLAKEALPLIRYRTGDIGSLTTEPCSCGRTLARIRTLRGRRDEMLIIRGVNLFPSHVEELLLGVEEVAPHYQLIVERPGRMDEITVECEPAAAGVDRAALGERLETLLREHTGIRIAVAVLEAGAIPAARARPSAWWTAVGWVEPLTGRGRLRCCGSSEPAEHCLDPVDDGVWAALLGDALEVERAADAAADEDRARAAEVAEGDVHLEVVADHGVPLRRHAQARAGLLDRDQ